MADAARVEIEGLTDLLEGLRGPQFKDLNRTLRQYAKQIASQTLLPLTVDAVGRGSAPQSRAMAHTARVHADRVPVVVVGKTNPKFSTRWSRKGESGPDRRRRRGSMARGVIVGPLGGHRKTSANENYYRIPRDDSGGPLGAALREGGPLLKEGCHAYIEAYMHALRIHGFDADTKGHG